MHLIGRRNSLLTILAASEFMFLGAPGAKAAPAMELVVEELPATVKTSETLDIVARDTSWWVPTQATTWQIQLSGTIYQNVYASAIEIDADTSTATVKALKKRGLKVIAYLSAGSWENWRSDAAAFPSYVKGNALDGWPGEQWLDVRRIDELRKIMKNRVLAAKNKGFDGVDWDNVDGYTQDSGFDISYADQIAYNKMLSQITHNLGMTVALKNDLEQVQDLVKYFDYAVNEQCGYYKECDMLKPFISAGKAVVGLEYPKQAGDTRTQAQVISYAKKQPKIYTLIKKLDLGSYGIIASSGKSVLLTAGSSKASKTKTKTKAKVKIPM
ncbi:hypothetical protein H072_823 [Dactylellina haptotyla CBS 200.50]|uniref:alpha-galactosidase n=1 Tax=Dactylellina haptotyla (strain CBS 200.50) TaxID=1284197 RepID=S8CBT6_DACHA|nr:hypothetical protein H072_823 [Dactylellina haptotyla CBS 200.50]